MIESFGADNGEVAGKGSFEFASGGGAPGSVFAGDGFAKSFALRVLVGTGEFLHHVAGFAEWALAA